MKFSLLAKKPALRVYVPVHEEADVGMDAPCFVVSNSCFTPGAPDSGGSMP
ncbi:hypothetical protein [Mesorhizobium sp. ES1-4]|uniref:hypothetical protein n=1 Tax=Mesorhizobium sp. ES1-4 TaxID=2876627 RepID=UPI001CCC0ED3|nr:hypothetical protein [Mesorhizobium sp. ES1-4]